jgi:hypothetical protein
MRKLAILMVVAIVVALMAAMPALAHNECGKGNGVQRYEHAHGQSAKPVTLCLPLAAENGVHGNFH